MVIKCWTRKMKLARTHQTWSLQLCREGQLHINPNEQIRSKGKIPNYRNKQPKSLWRYTMCCKMKIKTNRKHVQSWPKVCSRAVFFSTNLIVSSQPEVLCLSTPDNRRVPRSSEDVRLKENAKHSGGESVRLQDFWPRLYLQ